MLLLRQLRFIFLFLPYAVVSQLSAQHAEEKKALHVKVTNITKLEGQVMLAVYDNQESFLTDNVVTSAIAQVKTDEVIMALDSLSMERAYAISIYHDVNGNGKLDTNLMRIPVEPYGFSNNNLGLLPIPNYQKSSFLLDEKLDSLEIVLR